MPLGWIDFSKSERQKVLSVLDMLSESGTLDELGIAPVRDGFANRFFPGTSTIQSRAKYFMIVPYALKDLEYSDESNPGRIIKIFDEIEEECGTVLLGNPEDTDGIIGSRSLKQNRWVKRTPADIYWAGLRNYGIFIGGNLSLSEYVRAMCALKKQKTNVLKLGNRNDSAEEGDLDDKDAGNLFSVQFWKIPTYEKDWIDNLSIKLTENEGSFLKNQIIKSFPDSMMAYILKNNITEILGCSSFQKLDSLIHIFPEEIQTDYHLAYEFSDFLYVLRTIYNIIISDGLNDDANKEWEYLEDHLIELSNVDLEAIFSRLGIYKNVFLWNFLNKSKELMVNKDLDGMKMEIRRRERELKQ